MYEAPAHRESMRTQRVLAALGLVTIAAIALSACTSTASRPDQIGIVVGDGTKDADIKDVIYPGESRQDGEHETTYYFPSNERNYVIENRDSGAVDRKTPSTGHTSDGVKVNVYVSAFWTVNQDYDILTEKFWPFYSKYEFAAADTGDEAANRSASQGWLDMLDNDFAPAIDRAVQVVTKKYGSTLWSERAQWEDFAADLSDEFNAQMRARTGFTDDLFCGSGDVSGWSDPTKPGEGEFTCGPVRFIVTSVEASDTDLQAGVEKRAATQSQLEQNTIQREAAEAKYGARGGEVLGTLDIIEACAASATSCVVVIGDNGVSVQAPTPAVE